MTRLQLIAKYVDNIFGVMNVSVVEGMGLQVVFAHPGNHAVTSKSYQESDPLWPWLKDFATRTFNTGLVLTQVDMRGFQSQFSFKEKL